MKDTDKIIDILIDDPNFLELMKEVIERQYDGSHVEQAKMHYILLGIIEQIELNIADPEEDAMDTAKERRLIS